MWDHKAVHIHPDDNWNKVVRFSSSVSLQINLKPNIENLSSWSSQFASGSSWPFSAGVSCLLACSTSATSGLVALWDFRDGDGDGDVDVDGDGDGDKR